MKQSLLLTFALLLFCRLPAAYCQLSKPDSLAARLRQTLHDTDRVNTLNALGLEYKYTNPDTSIIFLQQALALANTLPFGKGRGWAKGKANALRNIGGYH
ncbi:MAG: hypothetical protein HY738_16200 [Bacteroidia bacterium]|nr:hypothetical protein [Bacteroidia bacterium]